MTAVSQLPLLHKYVFQPTDDLHLQMTKLRYRLCVQEVTCLLNQKREWYSYSGGESLADTNMEVESSRVEHQDHGVRVKCTMSSSHDDSGIGITDESGQEQILNGMTANEDATKDDGSSPSSTLSSPSSPTKNTDDWQVIENKTAITQDVSSDGDVIKTKTVTTTTKVMTIETPVSNGCQADAVEDTHQEENHVVSEEGSIHEEVITAVRAEPKNANRPHVLDNLPPAENDDANNDPTQPASNDTSPLTPYADDESDTISEPDISPSVLLEVEPPPAEDEVEEDAIVPMSKETKCCVAITVTDYSDDSSESEVEDKQRQQEPEPEPEVPAVEYTRGLHCDDVETALEILKTRYKLSEVHNKKCIITWSSWNVSQIVRYPDVESPWWKEGEEPSKAIEEEEVKQELRSEVQSSASPMGEMDKRISKKEQEIEYLLKQVLDEEKRKSEVDPDKKKTEEPEPEVVECIEAPTQNTEPESAPKKKRGNIFRRMIGAIRKRLDRRSQA